jgi:hypothetical protein
MPGNAAMRHLVTLESRRDVIVAEAGGIKPFLQSRNRAIMANRPRYQTPRSEGTL